MGDLDHKQIVLGLSGGIAGYKSAELLRRLQDEGVTIDVVMTQSATRFVTPVTFQALSGRPVFTDAWDNRVPNNMAHINLSRQAHAIVIAPASANLLARLANGMADDLLTTLCLARGQCPLLVAPAMNREMWEHPATQRNIRQLSRDGVVVLGPGTGDQACGETGDGRMLEPHELLAEIIAFFQPKRLSGKRVLITAGPTSERVDPVRVISNRSSGKTGYAIARAAYEAGANVTLVSGPTALPCPYGVKRINVESAREMHTHVMGQAQHADIFISVAAVADWHVSNASEQKLKKASNGQPQPPSIEFTPNPDILAEVAALENGPWCVGFAAETENLHEYAQAKRQRKNIPLLVGNLAQNAMDADTTTLVLFDKNGHHDLPHLSKQQAARELIHAIANRLSERTRSAGRRLHSE